MKTAEELYNENKSKIESYEGEIRTPHNDIWCVFYPDFIKALTEHDKGIRDLINEMIKKIKSEKETIIANPYAEGYADGEIDALTESKSKIGV